MVNLNFVIIAIQYKWDNNKKKSEDDQNKLIVYGKYQNEKAAFILSSRNMRKCHD
jgi:hypothetical protein